MLRGARYHYEPEQVTEAFPFLEFSDGDEKFYSTNYSSLVLPVIPAEVNTISEWEEYGSEHGEQFTVLTVEYTSQEFGSTHAAYLAASALCQEKSAELALEPSRESDKEGSGPSGFVRSCFFVTDNRVLEINQNGPKYVYRLIFSYEYISLAEKVVAEKINAMQLNATNAMTDQKGGGRVTPGTLFSSCLLHLFPLKSQTPCLVPTCHRPLHRSCPSARP